MIEVIKNLRVWRPSCDENAAARDAFRDLRAPGDLDRQVALVTPQTRDELIESAKERDADKATQVIADALQHVNPAGTGNPAVKGVTVGAAPRAALVIQGGGTPKEEIARVLKEELGEFMPKSKLEPLVEPFVDRITSEETDQVWETTVVDIRPLVRRYFWGITGRTKNGVPTFDRNHKRLHQYGLSKDPEKQHNDGEAVTTSCSKEKSGVRLITYVEA